MKTNYKFVLAVLVGALIGIAGATVIHARQMKMLPGYVVAEVDVTDATTFQKYAEKTPGTIAQYGGHYIIRGGKNTSIEGDAPKRFVVIAFDTVERAQRWSTSTPVKEINAIRSQSAKWRAFIAEGLPH